MISYIIALINFYGLAILNKVYWQSKTIKAKIYNLYIKF